MVVRSLATVFNVVIFTKVTPILFLVSLKKKFHALFVFPKIEKTNEKDPSLYILWRSDVEKSSWLLCYNNNWIFLRSATRRYKRY